MYDIQKKTKIPKDTNKKSLEDLNLLLDKLTGFKLYQLVEFGTTTGGLVLTFFDDEKDFIEEFISGKDKDYGKLKKLLEKYFNHKSGFKFIKTSYFNKLLKEANSVKPGKDYLRVSIDCPIKYFDDILNNLDYDNSNMFVDTKNLITWTKIPLKFGPAIIGSVAYNGIVVPILLYNEFSSDKQALYKSFGKIDFYSAYFRLQELGGLEKNFIEKLIDYEGKEILESGNITRLDMKIDLLYSAKTIIPHYKDLLNIRKNSKTYVYKRGKKNNYIKDKVLKGEELESWAYGSKEAKRVFLRVYDKLADTEKKGKYMLYSEYYNYKSVYRIEFELLNHFCKGFKYIDLELLEQKFWDSIDLRYSGKVFWDYGEDPNLEEIENRIRYFKDFIGRGEKITEKGFNPFVILFEGLKGKNGNISEAKLIDLVYELYENVGIS